MKGTRFLSVVLAVVLVLVSVQPILAKQPEKAERDYEKAVVMLEEFLSTSETGNIVLDVPDKVVRKIDSEVYQSILASLEQTNQMIDEGYLLCEEDFEVVVTEKYLDSIDMSLTAEQVEQMSHQTMVSDATWSSYYWSPNRVVWYWWGFKLYLNNYTCIRLAAGLSVTAAICMLIPDPLASKVVAIVAGTLAATIVAANVYGRGVEIWFFRMRVWGVPTIFPFRICSQ